MIKSFLISAIFPILLFSSQQIVLVVADDFNTSHAELALYEGEELLFTTEVNLGKNGLGWGVDENHFHIQKSEPRKREGDKKAPAGIFALTHIFGYAHKAEYKLPYLYASDDLICVDDVTSPFYNQIIIQKGDEKSFEYMRRKDKQYMYGITVDYNPHALKGKGSCIFLHIQKSEGSATAGCTSMKEEALQKLIALLDKEKHPILIQIPKSSAKELQKLFPTLQHSTLLH